MPSEIVLLTSQAEAPHLADMLYRHAPELTVVHAETADQVEQACLAPGRDGRRLIAYCTSVIVPAAAIDALPGPAYNFHPGPPTYPGAHAASFAVYEAAERFGATIHVMLEKVDAGAIVGVEWFEVPPGIKYMDLELMAYKAMIVLFDRLSRHLATDDSPLPELDVTWSGRKTTNREFEKMRELEADMDEDEIRLRYRAFG